MLRNAGTDVSFPVKKSYHNREALDENYKLFLRESHNFHSDIAPVIPG